MNLKAWQKQAITIAKKIWEDDFREKVVYLLDDEAKRGDVKIFFDMRSMKRDLPYIFYYKHEITAKILFKTKVIKMRIPMRYPYIPQIDTSPKDEYDFKEGLELGLDPQRKPPIIGYICDVNWELLDKYEGDIRYLLVKKKIIKGKREENIMYFYQNLGLGEIGGLYENNDFKDQIEKDSTYYNFLRALMIEQGKKGMLDKFVPSNEIKSIYIKKEVNFPKLYDNVNRFHLNKTSYRIQKGGDGYKLSVRSKKIL